MARAKKQDKAIRITLTRSPAGRLKAHRDTVHGLGLRRLRHTVLLKDTPEIRGMLRAVSHLIKVEEV